MSNSALDAAVARSGGRARSSGAFDRASPRQARSRGRLRERALDRGLAGDAASWLATDPNASAVGEASRRLSNELAGRVTFAIAGGAEIEADESEFDVVLFSWSL
jgi:hypothetical protein